MSVNTDLLRSLGVAKDQWYKRWIKGGTLRGNTPRYYRKLQLIHDCVTWIVYFRSQLSISIV